jgi:outer membrane receptor protein involved in Fe transport
MQAYSAGVNLSTGDASFGRVYVAPNLTYRGKIYFEDTNLPGISQDGTMLFNVRAGYVLPNRHTEITLLVRNLLDKKYIIDAGNTGGAFGIPSFIAGAPRFVSLQLSQSF